MNIQNACSRHQSTGLEWTQERGVQYEGVYLATKRLHLKLEKPDFRPLFRKGVLTISDSTN